MKVLTEAIIIVRTGTVQAIATLILLIITTAISHTIVHIGQLATTILTPSLINLFIGTHGLDTVCRVQTG